MAAVAAFKALLIRRNAAFLHSAATGAQRTRGAPSVIVAAPRSKLPFFIRGLTLSYQCRRNFGIGATTDSDNPASIESPLMESMEKKIKEHLSAESVIVKDAYGDGRHVSIQVISNAFEGQSAVNRQRMVYKAIWEELQDRVHAVDQMTTRTPAEAASGK